MDGCVPATPSCIPLPFFILIPHSLPLPLREGSTLNHKKATLVTGHRADMEQGENFRNDAMEILKVLEEHVLETITVHGVTFEDGCMLPELYKEFYIFI